MNFIVRAILCAGVAVFALTGAMAATRQAPALVDTNDLLRDIQKQVSDGTTMGTLVLWIPIEFWEVSLAIQGKLTPDKQEMLNQLRKATLVLVVQGAKGELGIGKYLGRDEVAAGLKVAFESNGQRRELKLIEKPDIVMQAVLGALKPVFVSILGPLGENMHVFAYEDVLPNGDRAASPLVPGGLVVNFRSAMGGELSTTLPTPFNSLFVPRQCPGGKPAGISWKFCPWDGWALPD